MPHRSASRIRPRLPDQRGRNECVVPGLPRAAGSCTARHGGPVSRGYDEQFTSEAVDWAADASWSADCEMLSTASEAEASFGTFFTADSKLSHALSRSPVGAFSTSWVSLLT